MQKTIRLSLVLFLWALLFPLRVAAHGAGYPPFFFINNVLPPQTLIQQMGTLPENIPVAQDLAAENFLVNQELSFRIDTDKLQSVYPPEVLEKLQYQWDFGDIRKGSGTTNTHTYMHPGSYILQITATPDKTTPPVLIESVQLNILPKKDYQLPQAVLMVNKQQVHDPLQDLFAADLQKGVNFDASRSVSKNSKIVSYTWDFGDGGKSNDAVVKYRYSKHLPLTTVYLRVQDENGLISDTFVTLGNQPEKTFWSEHRSGLLIAAGVLLLAVVTVILVRKH